MVMAATDKRLSDSRNISDNSQNSVIQSHYHNKNHNMFGAPPPPNEAVVVIVEAPVPLFDNDPVRRQRFVRNAYTLLLLQLLLTFGVMMIFYFVDEIREFCLHNRWIALPFLVAEISLLIFLLCLSCSRRSYPANVIVFTLLAIATGCTLGVTVAIYRVEPLLFAVGLTVMIFVLLTILTCVIPYHISYWWYFGTGALVLFCSLIFFLAFPRSWHPFSALISVIAVLGVFFACCYIVYDTQQLMLGSLFQLDEDEYVYFALSLYLDFILLFRCLLCLNRN